MKTHENILVHPQTDEQVNAIKAFMKALKIKFEVYNSSKEDSKEDIISNIKQGIKEVNLIKKGELKGTPAKDFLNEL